MDNKRKKQIGIGISSLTLFLFSMGKSWTQISNDEITGGQWVGNGFISFFGFLANFFGSTEYPLKKKRAEELGYYEAFRFFDFVQKSSTYPAINQSNPIKSKAISDAAIRAETNAQNAATAMNATTNSVILAAINGAINGANTSLTTQANAAYQANTNNIADCAEAAIELSLPFAATAINNAKNPIPASVNALIAAIVLPAIPANLSLNEIIDSLSEIKNAAIQTQQANKNTLVEDYIWRETWMGSLKDIGQTLLAVSAIFSTEMRKISSLPTNSPVNPQDIPNSTGYNEKSYAEKQAMYTNAGYIYPTGSALQSNMATQINSNTYQEKKLKYDEDVKKHNDGNAKRSDAGWNMGIAALVGVATAIMSNRLPTETEIEKAKIDAFTNKLSILLP